MARRWLAKCAGALVVLWLLPSGGHVPAAEGVVPPTGLNSHVERFNAADAELYPQAVPNAQAAEFLRENVPWFECPDPEIERTYYFRWWTFRKHIQETPDGFVITEFLPPVGWASKHNTISCAAGHHLYEGRWLRDGRMLDDYSLFWLRKGTGLHRYSHWLADGIWARYCVNAQAALPRDLLPDLVQNFRQWEQERRDPNGLFWQVDGADGMEVAIGGTGYRATINSYMFADARAIAAIARMAGQDEVARQFDGEAARIKGLVQEKLWDADAQFFKMRKRPAQPGDPEPPLADVRELYGYTPWYFNLPDPQFSGAWRQLMDPQGFYAPFGPTTAEQRHPQFTVVYRGHECQWNGPSWPYSTAVTLVALANLLNNYQQDAVTKRDYFETLKCYTRSHSLREQRLEVVGSADRKTPSGPRSSADHAELRHTWWSPETLGTTQWVQYEFERPVPRTPSKSIGTWTARAAHCRTAGRSSTATARPGKKWRPLPTAGNSTATTAPSFRRSSRRTSASKPRRRRASRSGFWSGGCWAATENLAAKAKPSASYTDKYAGRVEGLHNTVLPRTPARHSGRGRHAGPAVLNSLDRQPWIDENLNPYTGDWIARSLLRERRQKPEERGKDYNHSTYCDLIITGLVGLRPRPDDDGRGQPARPGGLALFRPRPDRLSRPHADDSLGPDRPALPPRPRPARPGRRPRNRRRREADADHWQAALTPRSGLPKSSGLAAFSGLPRAAPRPPP